MIRRWTSAAPASRSISTTAGGRAPHDRVVDHHEALAGDLSRSGFSLRRTPRLRSSGLGSMNVRPM